MTKSKLQAKQKLEERNRRRRKIESKLLKSLAIFSACLTFFVLLFIIAYIIINGVPHITPSLFELEYNTTNVSLMPAFINTIFTTILSLLIALPVGIFSAIFLVEYANQKSKLVKVIRITAETLSGIPSIVYGLFGLLFFVSNLKWGYSLLAGSFTIAIMILPLIMRTTEEALKSVPYSFREASFGLGAGKLRTIFKIVLPASVPGIMAGVILSIGRIVGETAALMYTLGSTPKLIDGFTSSGRTLALHMYALSSEALYMDQAYATAVVLLFLVLLMNTVSAIIARKITKGK